MQLIYGSGRCPTRCCNRQSVITEHCFLNGTHKFYGVFLAMYMWVWEYPPKMIARESDLCLKTIRDLNFASLKMS